MDPYLIEQLEERLAYLQDSDRRELNEFEDSDLAMYPATKIPEINLTADQCEIMANNLIRMMDRCESSYMPEIVAGIAILAYNSLMDSNNNYPRQDSDPKPFFHRYNSMEFTEDWLRISGPTKVSIETLSKPLLGQESDGLALELVDPIAGEYERKSSIGVWAFLHLKALWPTRAFGSLTFQLGVKKGMFYELYGFGCAYKFPDAKPDSQNLFRDECTKKHPGEMMYLFYRAVIIYERIQRRPSMNGQKWLLLRLVFGGSDGLRYGGLQLWNFFRSASKTLDISEKQLLDDLDWALKDPRWIKYSASSLKTLQLFREFRRKFEQGYSNWGKSRYYMYARVVNYYYFYYLGSKANKEIATALIMLSSKRMELRNDSPYEKWGQLIAQKIQEFRSLDYKIAGLRISENVTDVSKFDWIDDLVLVSPFRTLEVSKLSCK